MNRKVTIIGAGLVGSLWAVMLRQRNYDVTVYEKRSDPRKGPLETGRSINLIITSRGLHALKTAHLFEKVQKLCVPVLGRMIHSRTSEQTFQPYGQTGEFNLSISRSALNQFLMDEAEKNGAKIQFDHSISDINFQTRVVSFEHNQKMTTLNYDLLFGTDGAGSLVRRQLVEKNPSQFHEKTDWLEADYKELFLPTKPNGSAQLEHSALHIWPRGQHMMMALANLDKSFTVTLYLPRKTLSVGLPSFETIRTESDIKNLFEKEFPDAIPLMPSYLHDFQKNPQGALGTVRCSKWVYQDNIALMGDAAHAIVPFFGQGMNAGFEDCTELLKLHDQYQSQWPVILEKYDQIQRPNANAIADMALENWVEMKDKVGDPRFLLRKKVESSLEKEFPKLFKSRYGLVTYTLVPYSLTQKAGFLQDQILNELCANIHTIEDLSLEDAKSLLERKYLPFLKESGISI